MFVIYAIFLAESIESYRKTYDIYVIFPAESVQSCPKIQPMGNQKDGSGRVRKKNGAHKKCKCLYKGGGK